MQIPPQKCVQKNAYKTENDIVNCELRIDCCHFSQV